MAARRILEDLHFYDSQIELMGKVLSLRDNPNLVSMISTSYSGVGKTSSSYVRNPYRGSILVLRDIPQILMKVSLNPKLKRKEDDYIKKQVDDSLRFRGIKGELYSYCSKSYGLDADNLNVHFGFE